MADEHDIAIERAESRAYAEGIRRGREECAELVREMALSIGNEDGRAPLTALERAMRGDDA